MTYVFNYFRRCIDSGWLLFFEYSTFFCDQEFPSYSVLQEKFTIGSTWEGRLLNLTHEIPNSFCLGPDYICNMMWNEWKGHEHKVFEIIEQDSRIFLDWNGMEAIFLSFNFYILIQWELPAGLARTQPEGYNFLFLK